MTWLISLIGIFGVLLAYLNAIACLALWRTEDLDRIQKIGQVFIIWSVPFLGAWFILRLLMEHDQQAIPRKWTPSETINDYVRSALSVQSVGMNRSGRGALEGDVTETSSGGSGGGGGGE